MPGLAAVTSRISCCIGAVLTLPPAFRRACLDHRFDLAWTVWAQHCLRWQRAEYAQMSIWPGAEHLCPPLRDCTIREDHARAVGNCRSTSKARSSRWMIAGSARGRETYPNHRRGKSDNGTRFRRRDLRLNFCASFESMSRRAWPSVARLVAAAEKAGRDVGALILMMVSPTRRMPQHWRNGTLQAGVDLEALAWRDAQAGRRPQQGPPRHKEPADADGKRSCRPAWAFSSVYASTPACSDELAGSRGYAASC